MNYFWVCKDCDYEEATDTSIHDFGEHICPNCGHEDHDLKTQCAACGKVFGGTNEEIPLCEECFYKVLRAVEYAIMDNLPLENLGEEKRAIVKFILREVSV